MPQRRRRTYMFAFKKECVQSELLENPYEWMCRRGIMAKAFPIQQNQTGLSAFRIEGELSEVSATFNKGKTTSPFRNAGFMADRVVSTLQSIPDYDGDYVTLGDLLVPECEVPESFFISEENVKKWEYAKGGKSEKRVNKATGFEYNYSEGAMAFPDYLDRASRTIITGEGGAAPSRFKHVVLTPGGRYRRLVPVELERLNMFPDNHTEGASDMRRAFLMGNALVTGIVERMGIQFMRRFGGAR